MVKMQYKNTGTYIAKIKNFFRHKIHIILFEKPGFCLKIHLLFMKIRELNTSDQMTLHLPAMYFQTISYSRFKVYIFRNVLRTSKVLGQQQNKKRALAYLNSVGS